MVCLSYVTSLTAVAAAAIGAGYLKYNSRQLIEKLGALPTETPKVSYCVTFVVLFHWLLYPAFQWSGFCPVD